MDQSPITLRERKHAQTNSAIVSAAFQLFAEQGFDSTTVEQICSRAQISRATFFNYFGQKEGVMAALARQRLERIRSWVDLRTSAQEPIRRAELIAVFEEFSAENAQLGHGMRALVGPMLSRISADDQLSRLFREINLLLIQLLETMQQRDEVRADVEPEILAGGFWNIYIGATVNALSSHFDLENLPIVIAAQLEAFLKPNRHG